MYWEGDTRLFVSVSVVVFVAALQPAVADVARLFHYSTCDNCKHCQSVLGHLTTQDGWHVHMFADILTFADEKSVKKLKGEYTRWNQDTFDLDLSIY